MFPNFCPYLKNVLDSGLRGDYRDMDGIIFINSCDAMRRLHDLWTHNVKTRFTYMLEVPKNRDENAIQFFDPDHSDDEDRFILVGLSFKPRVLIVCHCFRESETVVRLVSARRADQEEEQEYWRGRQK